MKCAHCGRKFTCGCQKAVTTNGVTVCKGCKTVFENSIGKKTSSPVNQMAK